MKRIIIGLLLFCVMFYHVYPLGLPIMGYSFIVGSGALGMILYAYNKYPYGEAMNILMVYGLLIFMSIFSYILNTPRGDTFIVDLTKSQLAWFFSSYLIIYIFFIVFPKGGVNYLIYLLIAVVFVQCVISVTMYFNEDVASFFEGIQKLDDLGALKRDDTEGKRLLGYGVAFFGAGIICGLGMILLAYVIVCIKLNFFQNLLATFSYVGIFYIGLLCARTTLVGAVASLILFVVLIFLGKSQKNQLLLSLFYILVLLSIGSTLCYLYFPDFADWAFEVFINYERDGNVRTSSSDGLSVMFILPHNILIWMFGEGHGHYFGTDVGYSRLLYWVGLPGTFLYFYYSFVIMKVAFTKNQSLNLMLITIFSYNIALNVKGLSDLNYVLALFAFYFLHYKYYIYTPYLYRLGKVKQNKLRNAVQTSSPSGGIQSNV